METEKRLVDWAVNAGFEDLPPAILTVMKDVVLINLGTAIAGAGVEGSEGIARLATEWGGKQEATIWIYGSSVPAHNAAFANSYMARALDFEDAMAPGIHIGASTVPTALAMAELAGLDGKQLIAALAVGTEVAARVNLAALAGIDIPGKGFDLMACTILGATTVAGRALRLNEDQMWNALGLAFNTGGGSWQSIVDGALAVRVAQANASRGGIVAAQLAKTGITGPRNFLEGTYGYAHLYTAGRWDRKAVAGQLGERFELTKTLFKKYPCCGVMVGPIDCAIELVSEAGVQAEEIQEIKVSVPPDDYELVGAPFRIGDTPRVNAQFSIQYNVANAVVRGAPQIHHFDEPAVRDLHGSAMLDRVFVGADPGLRAYGLHAVSMVLRTKGGATFSKRLDTPSGFAGNLLTEKQRRKTFWACVDYAEKRLPQGNAEKLVQLVDRLEDLEDVHLLLSLVEV